MHLDEIKTNKLKLALGVLLILVLGAGLIGAVYMLQQQQNLKSKAATNIIQAFDIKDDQGNSLSCDGSTNPPTCTTSSLDIKIKIKDLNILLQ